MAKIVLFLLVGVAAVAALLSPADLRRAKAPRVMPGSRVSGKSGAEVFSRINAVLPEGFTPCEQWSSKELDSVLQRLHRLRTPEVTALYPPHDRRAVNTTALFAPNKNGKCAAAVMLWAHHLSTEARASITFPIPSMPREPDYHALATDPLYREQASCTSCHYVTQTPTSEGVPLWGGAKMYRVEVNMTDVSDAPQHPKWSFSYYYNANLRASRYEHHEGQYDEVCGSKRYGKACTVVMASDGWTYLASGGECCKCSKGFLGAVRSDWLADGGHYVGNTTVRGYAVQEWFKQGASDNHYYFTQPHDLPVRYMEHKNGKLKQWDFDLTTYSTAPLPDTLFQQPSGCTARCTDAACLL